MSELIPFTEGGGPQRDNRRAGKAISRSRSASQVRMARVADESDVASDKVDQVTYATAGAMFAVARVNGVFKQLEQQAPELAGRLSRLADFHELAVAQSVEDLRRDLRRL